MQHISLKTAKGKREFQKLLDTPKIHVVDYYSEQLKELFAVRNPSLRGDPKRMVVETEKWVTNLLDQKKEHGNWFYFPWKHALVHFLKENEHHELRTARNKNLITPEEQRLWHQSSVAIAGLSVGSHAAASIVLQGGSKEIRLADADTISGTNLNRIRTGFDAVGVHKAINAQREIQLMNPYEKMYLYTDGIQKNSIHTFLAHPKKVSVLVEEMDDVLMKILIRKEARKLGIPVVMAADNGDGVILDVERYDLDSKTSILGGRGEGITESRLRGASAKDIADIITKLIDPSVVAPRMKQSVSEVGRSLYSWPQLGGAAQMAGVVLAYACRMIVTGGPLPTGRWVLSLEQLISGGDFSH